MGTKKEDIPTCIAMTLWDIRRGQPLINTNTQNELDYTKGNKKVNIFPEAFGDLHIIFLLFLSSGIRSSLTIFSWTFVNFS